MFVMTDFKSELIAHNVYPFILYQQSHNALCMEGKSFSIRQGR